MLRLAMQAASRGGLVRASNLVVRASRAKPRITLTDSSSEPSDSSTTVRVLTSLSDISVGQRRHMGTSSNKNSSKSSIMDGISKLATDGAFVGAALGGGAKALDTFMATGSYSASLQAGLKGAVKAGAQGAAAGTVVGALKSNDPKERKRVAEAVKDGMLWGAISGASIGAVFCYLAVRELNNPNITIIATMFGTICGGFIGAEIGTYSRTAYVGLTGMDSTETVDTVEKGPRTQFKKIQSRLANDGEYWTVFNEAHSKGAGFNDFYSNLDKDVFLARVEELKAIRDEYKPLLESRSITLEQNDKIRHNLGLIESTLNVVDPLVAIIEVENNKKSTSSFQF